MTVKKTADRVKCNSVSHNLFFTKMDNNCTLPARITELETKVAFQELMIEELNQALIEQQFAVNKLQTQMRHLAEKLKGAQGSQIASQAEETRPPHY